MEKIEKRIENCILCNKQYKTSAKAKRYYCNYCTRNVDVKKSEIKRTCINCNCDFMCNKKSAKYCTLKCSNDFKNKSGIYLNFRRSSVENTLLSVLWGARSRSKRINRDFDITDDQILNLLIKQDYRCAMTGIKMNPSKQSGFKNKDPYTVSIDRIDTSKGYLIDNVQLVCTICNLFKNSYNIEDVGIVCKEYVRYNKIND